MKQTAVEWLVEQLQIFATEEEMNIIEQAKAMEKEQITTAYRVGKVDANFPPDKPTTGEQYFNKTFKSE